MKIAGFTSISDDNKRTLGLFIKIERESQGLSQKELINDADQKQICSVSTLHRIETGQIIKDDVIYHELIQRLGYSFQENARLDKVLPDLNQQCLHYFETLDLSEAEMILDRVHALFKTSSFYYNQLKQCYLDLIHISLNKEKLSDSKYKWYRMMRNVVSNPLNVLLLHLCFCHSMNYLQSLNEIISYEKELEFCDHYLIIKFDLLYVLKYKGNYGKLIELINEVREECEIKNLPNQKLKCLAFLVGTACVINTFDIHSAICELEKFIMENKNKLNPEILNNGYYTLAMTYYEDLRNYTKALEMFQSLLVLNPLKIYSCGLFYFTCCDYLKIEPDSKILKSIDTKQADLFLQYFIYKYSSKSTMKDLGNYINKTLLPELKKEKKPMIISVFKKQWGFILEKDHNKYYKPFYDFMREFE
ncbi:helix-turn-helix domain-containing protein [Holdemania filiformis]|uniref:helix-turn-helix domain-containing protein n=1 Tax=Holdemania filiformis TaxID=61171 RepID=UPI002676ABE9|nr:helix-turn-helix transcriptional regulator [Holdemania filiformis]